MAEGSDNQFGKYALLGRIAAGGMAEIFRARYSAAAGVSKQVVIKRILPHYAANKSFIQMFTNEASIAMGLSHGNIAQVFDFGEIDGDWFLAMEYVDGQPLSKVMKRAKAMEIPAMPIPLACLVCIEMLKGLHYAHTRLDDDGKPLKIVHRDISPQNVLISFEGQVKLVDFGIAKARTAGRDDTEAGAVKGKYTYFAPEQARGKELDARSDIFAAGIVLYEMLCGQLPFQGKMIDTLSKIVRGEFPPPSQLNPDVSPALEKIVLTAMAHDKADRYQTAEAFHQALSSYLYQNAPSFQPSTLTNFMGYLFEQELVVEGRPVQLSREFLEQVAVWRKPLPQGAPESEELETSFERGAGQVKRSAPGSKPVRRKAEPSRSLKIAAIAAVPLGAALIAAIAVLLVGRMGTFSVQLTSQPPGAEVTVDGANLGLTTPVLISDLSASEAHRLEVSAPGMRSWSKEVQPVRGELVTLHAALEPLTDAEPEPTVGPDPKPSADPDAATDPPKPVEPEVQLEAHWPVADFSVHAKEQSFVVPQDKNTRIALDPRRTYRVWVEGKVSLGGPLDAIFINTAVYFLEGTPARESFGVVGPKPMVIKGATALTTFIADSKPGDNSGSLRVRVKDLKGGSTQTLALDGKAAAVAPEFGSRFQVNGLSQTAEYTLTIRDGAPPAKTRGDVGGPVKRVLLGMPAGYGLLVGHTLANEAQQVLEVGRTYHLTGAAWFWLSFPDLDQSDNTGSLVVEMAAVAGKGGGMFNKH